MGERKRFYHGCISFDPFLYLIDTNYALNTVKQCNVHVVYSPSREAVCNEFLFVRQNLLTYSTCILSLGNNKKRQNLPNTTGTIFINFQLTLTLVNFNIKFQYLISKRCSNFQNCLLHCIRQIEDLFISESMQQSDPNPNNRSCSNNRSSPPSSEGFFSSSSPDHHHNHSLQRRSDEDNKNTTPKEVFSVAAFCVT